MMFLTRPRMLLVSLVIAVSGLSGAAVAGAGPREEALAALSHATDVEARRAGARGVGESGTMADIPRLVEALRDPDAVVRALAEHAMWEVWSRSGDEDVDRLFQIGVEQMGLRQNVAAVETFSRVIERRPDFAEGWNKRATVYFLLGELEKSLADCHEVLQRNPQHFGALSGMGMIYLQVDQPTRALHAFERALVVNPNLHAVAETIESLKAVLVKRRRDTI